MFTESSLLSDAKNFLNGKNLFNGNLLENKDFAFHSIACKTNHQISQEQIAMNVNIDDDLDTQHDYISSAAFSDRFSMNKSNAFKNRAQTAQSAKFRTKRIRNSNSVEERNIVTFGSSKKIRTKIEKIDENINKLHMRTNSNWSKKDLNVNYLPNGSNFGETYRRTTQTLFDHLKNHQSNENLTQTRFDGVLTGAPYKSNHTSKKANYEALSSLNPGFQINYSSKDIISRKKCETANSSLIPNFELKISNKILNSDQNMAYLNNRQVKYVTTKTINHIGGGQNYKIKSSLNPFKKNFGFNTQSKLRNTEQKRPLTSAVNHSRDNYDPVTRMRMNKTTNINSNERNKSSYHKSQTISAFEHIGRVYAPNFSKEYQKAYKDNQNTFRRPKGMCAEVLNASQKHNFIATPFGKR